MTEDVDHIEDNVLYDNHARDFDCNSSSGGSVYQEMHGRLEENNMYSTDDEFMDATETLRSPLLAEDAENRLSSPILEQLTGEQEQSRYLLLDMPLTDSDSLNNCGERYKENLSGHESVAIPPIRENMSGSAGKESPESNFFQSEDHTSSEDLTGFEKKNEKSKSSRTLRIPSALAIPADSAEKPGKGDGRLPVGHSRIPILKTIAKKPQPPILEESSQEAEVPKVAPQLQILVLKTEEEIKDEHDCALRIKTLNAEPYQMNSKKPPRLPVSPRPGTGSSRKSDSYDKDNHNFEMLNTNEAKEENNKTEKDCIHGTCEVMEKTEDNAVVEKNVSFHEDHTEEGPDPKRMLLENVPPFTKESTSENQQPTKPANPFKDVEKRKKAILAVRQRLAREKLNLIAKQEEKELQSETQNKFVMEESTRDACNTTGNTGVRGKSSSSSIGNKLPNTPIHGRSLEMRRQENQKAPHTQSSRMNSPTVMLSMTERRKQFQKSREGVSGDSSSEPLSGTSNMPEIKPLLIKPNQLKTQIKTGQSGARVQENIPLPMKSTGIENALIKAKTTLSEKRRVLMKQKEFGMKRASGSDTPTKSEIRSRENTPSIQRKPASANQNKKPATPANPPPMDKAPSVSLNQHSSNTPVKPMSASSKIALNSLQNLYKTNYKRYESQLEEMERTKKRVCISLGKLDSLRQQIIQNNGEDPGEILTHSEDTKPNNIITEVKSTNTEVVDDCMAESRLLLGTNQQLKFEIEILKKQLEEAKELEHATKLEAEAIPGLEQRIREMKLTLKLAEKRQLTLEKKSADQEEMIDVLKAENQQIADLKKSIVQRDQQLVSLRKQYDEKIKELDLAQQKVVEATAGHDTTVHEEIHKREMIHAELIRVKEERNNLEQQLLELKARLLDFDEREECLHTRLEIEKKKVLKLQEELNRRDEEISAMESKFLDMETSSCDLRELSSQLTAKDALVRDLEVLRENVQSQNREMCCLISDLFAIKGKNYNAEQIQAALAAGTLPIIREELLKTLEERIEYTRSLEEARSKVMELQNQVKILQIELEDSKMVSERLTNIISQHKPWESDKPWQDHLRPWSPEKMSPVRHAAHNNIMENPIRENYGREGDTHSVVPSMAANSYVSSEAAMARNNFNELFVLLEGKRRALVQMERKLHDMEEVHSHCAQKRTRNETRIAQLEMMLATYQG